ncbi:hypothetical protein M427DRAFT_51832 [Gonapodya prolifera JEL478]|uniref:BSD domain-containing protein n=1 Tax=Gonapodya prolifera (strain JEL478) TaxID=1344416 RepID=A0A139AVY8_GONPJ|nr:hypothetical protein M427DRAFT_51832 [Gonapodya prolifera JEL478]|eukprot:KXS20877.1 hypothetical protein M427DRAFT_51832 [Gonapodya prolifera JEL478]
MTSTGSSWIFGSAFQLPSSNNKTSDSISWGALVDGVKKQTESVVSAVTAQAQTIAEQAQQLGPAVLDYVLEDDDNEDDDLTEVERTIEGGLERATQLANDGLANLTSWVRKAVTIAPAEEVSGKARNVIYDRKQRLLSQLRADPATFLVPPVEPTGLLRANDKVGVSERDAEDVVELNERFKDFKETFDVTKHTGEIARLVNEDPDMRRMMERLVPSEVAYETFWLRYFFRAHEIDFQDARRKRLVETVIRAQVEEDEAFDWDDDQDEADLPTRGNRVTNVEDTPQQRSDKVLTPDEGRVEEGVRDGTVEISEAAALESPTSPHSDDEKVASRMSGDTMTTGVLVDPTVSPSEEGEGMSESWDGSDLKQSEHSTRGNTGVEKGVNEEDGESWSGWD